MKTSGTIVRRAWYTITRRQVGDREVVSLNMDANSPTFLITLSHAVKRYNEFLGDPLPLPNLEDDLKTAIIATWGTSG